MLPVLYYRVKEHMDLEDEAIACMNDTGHAQACGGFKQEQE